jgi:NAD(P)-dependent dehydrogenase (short-subunit alcohol dehydrogenase family)
MDSFYDEIIFARELLDQSKIICLFGVGALFCECFEQIVGLIGRKPDFLVDNDPDKWGQIIRGIRCLAPQELPDLQPEPLIVVTVRNRFAIVEQLRSYSLRKIVYVKFARNYNVASVLLGEKKQAGGPCPDEELRLNSRWALVTGASRGIGFLIAKELARLGCNLIVHSRTMAGLGNLRKDLEGLSIEIKSLVGDFSEEQGIEKMLAVLSEYPLPDIVYNNAAVSPVCPGNFWAVPEKHFLLTYRTNTLAPIKICSFLLPAMIKRGSGTIVNLTSSIMKRPAEMAYACSKAALEKFVFDLIPTLNGTGTSLVLADPGWVKTDMGGPQASLLAESVLPGIILPAVVRQDINGCWINVQEFSGLSLTEAVSRFKEQEKVACFSEREKR